MPMSLRIKSCNNIDAGEITLQENKLNIRYAMNGAGKSTIARAIELQAKGDGNLLELTPFKHLHKKDQKPELLGLEKVSGVKVFNDTYINQFVFKPDEVLADSFEIFFKTPTFLKHIEEIEKNISAIKTTFKDSKEIDQVINDLTVLNDGFGKSRTGYSAAGPIAKGLGKGNKIANIPKGLESFSDYLQSSTNSKWLRWHMEGNDYSQSHENCPYCTSPTAEKKEIISQISKEFDPKSIEHLNKIMAVVNSLGKYFSKDVNEQLTKITKNVKGLSEEEINYLLRIKGAIETLKKKMLDLRGINYYSMKDAAKVSDFIGTLKINLSLLEEMDSPVTRELVDKINKSLDDVLSKVGVLQGEIAKQNKLVSKTIEENKDEINNFLKFAGYRYHVGVDYDATNESYKMRLRHFDSPDALSNGSQHLSYGEKNAFALVLFMYECLSRNPGIVILDDPISSFDRNKKYAVIDMLFRRDRSLQNKTVLLMTHDLEPVIDVIFNFPHLFAANSNAAFLESNGGQVKEIPIVRADISSFGRICQENIQEGSEVVKLVYLRRHYEILNNRENPYHVLSSLLHKRPAPTRKENGSEVKLSSDEIASATDDIKIMMPSFDYNAMLAKLSDAEYMKKSFSEATCNYEKLHIFRVAHGNFTESDVINKFINETFHIENEYIMQLNPRKYEIVPAFIIDECSKILNAPKGASLPPE